MKSKIAILVAILVFGTLFIVFSFYAQHHVTNQQVQQTSVFADLNPTISCNRTPTVSETEGPFYKEGSPQRTNLYNNNIPGTKFTLTGYVLDTNCKPISHAWLDFWQADGNGHYDNAGYTLRGHQYTDANGKFSLITVVPGEYPGRTPHIHVKVRADNNSPIVTTQLYIPGLASNQSDSIYNPTLQMHNVKTTEDGVTASFTFIITQ